MPLPITVPFTFGNATTTQSLSSLDADFSTVYNAVNGIGNGTVSLSNVSITGGTIANAAITGSVSYPENGYQRNRIINGNMVIDQRNAGAAVTVTNAGQYTVDRWQAYQSIATSKFTVQQNAGSVTPPSGFSNYAGCTSSSAYSIGAGEYFVLLQKIEGFNFSDMGWGTAGAKTVTLSFWAYSSLTGTFGGSIQNSAQNRNYNFSYTISSANTWTQISITIAGDTTGTWVGSTNGIGVQIFFGIGAGTSAVGTANTWGATALFGVTGQVNIIATNGATFYVTGVQLEVGSNATPFERRQYGTELMLCQRYYEVGLAVAASYALAATSFGAYTTYAVVKRASPSISQITNNVIITQANCTATTSTYIGNTSGVLTYRLASSSSNIQFSETFGASAEL